MAQHEYTVHGHRVTCDDDRSYFGLQHLAFGMSESEVLRLFEQARSNNELDFSDQHGRQFTLVAGPDMSFVVVAVKDSHGWV